MRSTGKHDTLTLIPSCIREHGVKFFMLGSNASLGQFLHRKKTCTIVSCYLYSVWMISLSLSPCLQNQVSTMYLPHGYLSCGESHDTVARLTLDLLHMLRHSPTSQLQTLLLYGPRGAQPSPPIQIFRIYCVYMFSGSGKTALAAHLAMVGKFSFIKV